MSDSKRIISQIHSFVRFWTRRRVNNFMEVPICDCNGNASLGLVLLVHFKQHDIHFPTKIIASGRAALSGIRENLCRMRVSTGQEEYFVRNFQIIFKGCFLYSNRVEKHESMWTDRPCWENWFKRMKVLRRENRNEKWRWGSHSIHPFIQEYPVSMSFVYIWNSRF